MGRAKGDRSAAGGSRRGGQIRAKRHQVVLSAALQSLIEGRLGDLPLDRDALKLAMAQFGNDFDLAEFRKAHASRDAQERNRARLVTSNFQAVADGMVELVREAVTATGLRPANRALHVNPDIEAMRADGGLTRSQATELIQLKKLANDLRHIYIVVSADDAHAGALRALKLLPRFTSAYAKWLDEYGIRI